MHHTMLFLSILFCFAIHYTLKIFEEEARINANEWHHDNEMGYERQHTEMYAMRTVWWSKQTTTEKEQGIRHDNE